ncbi:hypothetical protein SSOG_02551 [Streptomyces himastatinicus ATCC 53653]|uniref:WXG100 family type VII secretion target n=1 Tax=Streptomyces himastatinicus ATCC 53653 TaxID=457427 RepID=D9WB60_9ACTN|nr:WXG100 family type VII secretion target [Streptomyces himastatinicus]EFL22837.1 hypothetical protein SSOG_02551 [Streptomyces himastatinicus ATCC 53653]
MSGGQRLSDAHFVKFENDLGTASGHLAANVKTLYNALEAVQAGWKGGAAYRFGEAQRALNENHEAVRKLVDKIQEAVNLTRRAGGANDQELASTLGKVDVNGDKAGGGLDNSSPDGITHTSAVDKY